VYPIAAIGLLTLLLGLLMATRPQRWARGIVAFARHPAFHAAEVLLRLLLGALLLTFADQTRHPRLFIALGLLMLAVAAGLLIIGSQRHRAFAHRAATLVRWFRPGGLAAIAFGAFTMASALAPAGAAVPSSGQADAAQRP
jgi:hypothetical protein